MWGFEPYVSNAHFGACRHCQAIQVSEGDNVFTQVVAPSSAYVQAVSASQGHMAGCAVGERPPSLPQPLCAASGAAAT